MLIINHLCFVIQSDSVESEGEARGFHYKTFGLRPRIPRLAALNDTFSGEEHAF